MGAGPEYRFEIPHAKLDYTGAYSVVARNQHGEAKAVISLQILAKGTFVKTREVYRYFDSSAMTLRPPLKRTNVFIVSVAARVPYI